jgi:hypothetical protein
LAQTNADEPSPKEAPDESVAELDSPSAEFLKSVFGAGGLLTAWIFVMGWSYLYTYYEYFGLNINSLEVPIYQYFLFCFTQFVSFRWNALIVAPMMLAVFLLTWVGTSVRRKRWGVAVAVAYLVLFWLGFRFSVTDGVKRAVEDMSDSSYLPLIALEFRTPDQSFKYGVIEQSLASNRLRLLIENKDRLFVFVPVDTKDPIARVTLFEIDRKDVLVTTRSVNILTKR